MTTFEDLDVWKRACRLATELYTELKDCRDWGLKDQMNRAAVSIASNIAEGAERDSSAEFARFVNIAKGSAAELRTQLYIASKVGVVESGKASALVNETKAISAMLHKLAKAVKR